MASSTSTRPQEDPASSSTATARSATGRSRASSAIPSGNRSRRRTSSAGGRTSIGSNFTDQTGRTTGRPPTWWKGRYRAYVCTIWQDDDYRDDPAAWQDKCRFLCGQKETAPTTGRDHLQVYFVLSKAQRPTWVKNRIHPTMHFEPRWGTHEESKHYVSKPHGPNDSCPCNCGRKCTCKHCEKQRRADPARHEGTYFEVRPHFTRFAYDSRH